MASHLVSITALRYLQVNNPNLRAIFVCDSSAALCKIAYTPKITQVVPAAI